MFDSQALFSLLRMRYEALEEKDEEQMRRSLGRYGLTGKQQVLVRREIHSEITFMLVHAHL